MWQRNSLVLCDATATPDLHTVTYYLLPAYVGRQ